MYFPLLRGHAVASAGSYSAPLHSFLFIGAIKFHLRLAVLKFWGLVHDNTSRTIPVLLSGIPVLILMTFCKS